MATTTSNLSLRKPESSDFVSVALDIAANMQTIDDKWATSVAADIGAAAAAGSALTVARTDHVHKVGSGTVSAPGLPIGESNSGFYRIGSANIGATIAGALSWAFSATGIAIETALALKHVASVTATSGYVKLFAKSDENLYKHTGAGDEVRMLDADIFTAAGDLVYGTGAETFTQRALGTKGYALLAGASAPTYEPITRKNLLINGSHRVIQRGSNVVGIDNAYQCADRWRTVFSGGSGPTVRSDGTSGGAPPNGGSSISDVMISGGTGSKFGRFQVIESQDMYHARNQAVSLSFWALASAAITDVRAAILYQTGTADAVSAHPVSAWGSAGTNPTLSGWSYAATPANLGVTTAWQRIKIENVAIPSTATNLAVMIWSDDTTHTLNVDNMNINSVQLEVGTIATEFERRPYAQELALCQRYYWKTFSQSVTPAQNVASNVGALEVIAPSTTVGAIQVPVRFPVAMRATPTITTYNPRAANAGWANSGADVSIAASSLGAGDSGVSIYGTGAGLAGTDYYIHMTASAEL